MNPRNYNQEYGPNGRPVTNPSLIDDIRLGYHQAWVHFYATYWKWLVRLALGMGVNKEDAEDLAQKTLIALSRKTSQFIYEPARGRFSSWLITVLRNNVINFWKRGCTDPLRLRADQEVIHPALVADSASLGNDVITHAIADDLDRGLQESLQELRAQVSDEHWQVFDLVNLKDHPPETIAAQFNLKPGSIYSIVSRLLKKLKAIMHRKMREAYGGDAFDW